jgi:hypothetical protein
MEKSGALVVLVEKAHPWVVDVVLLAIGALIVVWVWSAISVLKKNITVHATADRLLTLQEEYNKMNANMFLVQEKYSQSVAILAGIKSTYAELKYLFFQFANGNDIQGQGYGILKLITDRMPIDLKSSAGEIHRCAIWVVVNEKNLGINVASAGFSDYYRNYRTLEIDHSSAGRCYRTKTPRYSANVDADSDFFHNPNSAHNYKSLICVPLILGDICLGVITVDGKKENAFKEEDIGIIETYAEIATIIRMMQITNMLSKERNPDEIIDEKQNEDY